MRWAATGITLGCMCKGLACWESGLNGDCDNRFRGKRQKLAMLLYELLVENDGGWGIEM